MQTDERIIDGDEPLRNYKDTTFRLLFSEKERAIKLYNALTGENLPPDTELTYTTLKNAVYAGRKNDLGFVINHRHLVLSEQQSSINYNMPMRCLGYASRTLEMLAGAKGLYGSQLVELLAPEFYTFFAGTAEWESRQLRLSECFLAEPKENSLELVENVINLNYPKQNPILTKSPSLMGYSKLLHYIRSYTADTGGDLKTAIDKAVKQCMHEGLITDFLEKYTGEVTGMLFTEITAEEFAEIRAREAYGEGKADGHQEGLAEGHQEGLAEGHQEGLLESQRKIAKNLKDSGFPIDVIAENTGLTLEEIENL